MSHSFKYSRLSWYDSELKLPSPPRHARLVRKKCTRGLGFTPYRYATGQLQRGALHVLLLSPPEKRYISRAIRTGRIIRR